MRAEAQRVRRIITWVALGLVPIVLIGMGFILAREFSDERRLRERVDQSYQTRADILKTLSLLQDIETGQRGYVLTGNKDFLEPTHGARRSLAPEIRKLEAALGNKGDNDRLLGELRRLTRLKLEFVDRTIYLRGAGRGEDAALLINSGVGKRLMDEIRAALGQLDAREQAHLDTSIAEADQGRSHTQRMVFLLQGLLGLLLLLAAISTKRSRDAAFSSAMRQKAIFDGASDGMIVHDIDGRIESMNPAAARMHGFTEDELQGEHLQRLAGNSFNEEHFRAHLMRSRRATDPGFSIQTVASRKDGSTFPVEVSTSPVRLAEGLRFIAIVRDITERQRVEQMKNEFVSTVSHELRTPLTSIAGSLGLLAGGAGGELPERAGRLISIAHANSQRLVRLINDILDIEKIESGKMTFDIRPVPLRPLLEQAIQSNQAYAQEFGVHTVLDDSEAPGAAVFADPDRLTQVVINLLSNAAKFSPSGAKVLVSVNSADAENYCISVKDEGSGIPDEFRDRVFAKFAQADSSDTRAKGGTGLGLSIVKEIVARLNGSIRFESAEGKGTQFFVTIPAALAEAETKPVQAHLVLLCEGGDQGSRKMREALDSAGFACDLASNVAELEALTAKKDYSVLILDLPLPGEEMIAVIRNLRAEPRYQATPILVVSTEADRGEVSQSLDIADWIERPAGVDRLVDRVKAVVAGVSGQPRILHIEDDLDVLRVVATAFEGRAELSAVTDIEIARETLKNQDFDLVILDLALPGGSGVDLLPDMRNRLGQPIPVVIFSAYESGPDLARRVEATLTKSRASLANLVETVEMLVRRSARLRNQETIG